MKSPSRETQVRIGRIAARSLEKLLRLTGPDGYRYISEQLYRGIYRDGFEVAGIRFFADPGSVGLTPQGELTGAAAAELARERELSDLRVLDMCCGAGLVGLTMLAALPEPGVIKRLSFADINIFNISSVDKTLNNLDRSRYGHVEFETLLSMNLSAIPARGQFDLIVSNPPHFDALPFTETMLNPVTLGSVDPGWTFHRDFYATVHEYLAPGGEVWFLENGDGASEALLRPMIDDNPQLRYVESFPEKRDPTFFWMITRRVGSLAST